MCRLTIIGKFSHGRALIEDIRRDFAARFPMRETIKIGHYNGKHIFISFTNEDDFKNIYFRDNLMILGSPMRVVRWTKDFNPNVETSLAPIWIHLPELPWHYFNWSALQRITSPIGTLLTVDKATHVKTEPMV